MSIPLDAVGLLGRLAVPDASACSDCGLAVSFIAPEVAFPLFVVDAGPSGPVGAIFGGILEWIGGKRSVFGIKKNR